MNKSIEEFQNNTGLIVRSDLTGAKLSTMAVGGKVHNFVSIKTLEQLKNAIIFLNTEKLFYRIVGAGSNVIFPNELNDCWLLKLSGDFKKIETEINDQQIKLKLGAACGLMSLAREYSKLGFSGLEFAGGIPASIGGAVKMNAGAHGSSMSEVIKEVYFVDVLGQEKTFSCNDCDFSYRNSNFPEGSIVTGAKIVLIKSESAITNKTREDYLNHRKLYQPITLPSAGSIFKNPNPELTAGKLLESLGLKGKQVGKAFISDLHANWIVNPKKLATSEDVLSLIRLCKEAAKVDLVEEVKIW